MSSLAFIPFFIVLFLYCYNKQNDEKYKVESFKLPRTTILTKKQIFDFISNDDDGFIESLTVYDLRARKVLNSVDYIDKILNSIDYTLTIDTILKIKQICIECDNIILNNNLLELYSVDWNIAVFNNKIYESGYPHTRRDIIFMPLEYILHADRQQLIKTFIHEKIHILQRLNPNSRIIQKFLQQNGYKQYRSINEMRVTHPRCRSNPDLDNWIYSDDKIFYMCEYSSDFPTGIMDVIQDSKNEHPYEIMAYTLSEELIART